MLDSLFIYLLTVGYVVAYYKVVYHQMCGERKNHGNLCQDSWHTGRDSNPGLIDTRAV